MSAELDARLCALLDGELAPAEAAQLRAEIAQRPELAARLAALAAVDDELRALPEPPVPGELRARLAQRIRAEGVRRMMPRTRRRWLAAAALAAAAAALAWVALPLLQRDDSLVARMEPAPPMEIARPAEPEVDALEQLPGPEQLAEADDLPVIQVLDVLAELDELEGVGSG
jgi:anti-sigma factor RsiW